MRKLFTLLFAGSLVAGSSVEAQPLRVPACSQTRPSTCIAAAIAEWEKDHLVHRSSIQAESQSGMLAKTTNQASRLIGVHNAMYSTAASAHLPTDSTRYAYSGSRGGDFDSYGSWPFDSSVQLVYQLSGSAYQNNQRVFQTMDAADRVLTQVEQAWQSSTNSWRNIIEQTHTYNADGNVLTRQFRTWDPSSNTWVPSSRFFATYTASKLTDAIYQDWNASANAWQNQSRYSYTYTPSQAISLAFNWNAGNWDSVARAIVTLNSAGLPTEFVSQGWNSGSASLVNQQRSTTTYNSSNQPLVETEYIWASSTQTWTESYRTSYTYSGGFPIEVLNQQWNGSSWQSSLRYLFTYDAAGNALTEIEQSWVFGAWRNNVKYLRSFSSTNKLMEEIEQDSLSNGAFANLFSTLFAYNGFDQPTGEFHYSWDSVSATWIFGNNDWVHRYTYQTYSSIPGVEGGASAGSLRLYPQPASTTLHLDMQWQSHQGAGSVTLVDIAGRTVGSWPMPSGDRASLSIPVAGLPAGTYLMQLRGTTGSLAQKVQLGF